MYIQITVTKHKISFHWSNQRVIIIKVSTSLSYQNNQRPRIEIFTNRKWILCRYLNNEKNIKTLLISKQNFNVAMVVTVMFYFIKWSHCSKINGRRIIRNIKVATICYNWNNTNKKVVQDVVGSTTRPEPPGRPVTSVNLSQS